MAVRYSSLSSESPNACKIAKDSSLGVKGSFKSKEGAVAMPKMAPVLTFITIPQTRFLAPDSKSVAANCFSRAACTKASSVVVRV